MPGDMHCHYSTACTGVPALHTIVTIRIHVQFHMDSFNQARFGKSSSTPAPALNIVNRLSDEHVSAASGP